MENHIPSLVLAAVAAGTLYFASTVGALADPLKSADTESSHQSAPVAAAQPMPAVAPTPVPTPAQPAPVAAAPTPAPQPVAKPAPAKPAPQPAPQPTPQPTVKPAPTPAPPAARPSVVLNPDDAPPVVKRDGAKASTDASKPPAYGPEDPLVRVLVISDFQCPVCRRATAATHQLANEFPGEVRVEFWNHALKMHRNAENAAAAAVAAQQQGKFWEMHDELFANQGALDELSLMVYAEKLGLDMARFKADYKDPKVRERIAQEGELAKALGARGTPAFVVNGKLSVGWGSWNGFRGTVERELTRAKSITGKPNKEVRAARVKENSASPEAHAAYVKHVK